YTTSDFKDAIAIYNQGKGAVEDKMVPLTELSEMLKQYKQRKVELAPRRGEFIMDSVTYSGISEPNLALVKARTDIKPNTLYNIHEVINGVNRAMGTALFKQMAYSLVTNEDKVTLHLLGVERSPHQVKGALHYDGYHGVGIIGNYTGRNIIGNASRTLVTIDIAEQPKLRLQYQKNFGEQRDWWWRTELYGQQLKQKVYLQGQYVENVRNRYHAFDNQVNRNLSPLRSYVGLGLKYDNTHIKPTIDPKVNENVFKFNQYRNYDIELYAHYNYNSMDKVLFATEGAILKGFIGRSLHSNLDVTFSDPTIPNYDGPTTGFIRLGFDYENRFRATGRITAILGASAHFILDDSETGEKEVYSDMALNSKYYMGGSIDTPRSEYFVFPGLKEEELALNQFM